MERMPNQTSIYIAKASLSSSLLGELNFKEATKQIKATKDLARRTKINKVNKRRSSCNEGNGGILATIERVSNLPEKLNALLSEKEKETLRRKRISQANKGKVPWNKGGKHSAETKKRIQAGVLERMKDPKIREKLRLQAEAVKLSPEIKMKIKMGIIRAWVAKKQLRNRQELCLLEWEESIAENARRGYEGDMEYQWDSFSVLKRQGLEALSKRKRVSVGRPDHLSAEHRLRISAAIKAKWNNPDYRINVETGIRKSLSERASAPREERPKAEPCQTLLRPLKRAITPKNSCGTFIARKNHLKVDKPRRDLSSSNGIKKHVDAKAVEKTELDSSKLVSDMASYKDPEAEKKLQKLKSMRAHRMHVEAQKHKEITERARALIAQAQQAARALEAAAVQDKNALAPLLETRKLLAEAVQSLESLNKKNSSSGHNVKEGDSALYAQVMNLANATSSPLLMVNNCWELGSTGIESSRGNT